jgi:hypothetical protein
MTKCGIRHKLGGQTCNREVGHEGNCRCKSERMSGGNITYSEWVSLNGEFHRHVGYYTIYSANAARQGAS